MNKLVIFDLDGVLMDSRDMHYTALNTALVESGFDPIPYPLHLSTYDGLPTKVKLEMLKIPEEQRGVVWAAKQRATYTELSNLTPDVGLIQLVDQLCRLNIKVAVASNSIRSTTDKALRQLGLYNIDYMVSAEDVDHPKPMPDMYWRCMARLGATAQTTVIVEDSHIGRAAALASGAILCPVLNRSEVTLERIMSHFSTDTKPIKYRHPTMNVVIPMAGEGSRFAAAGYTFPKPLIEVNGKPMIQLVVENLNIDAHFTFIVRREHYEKYHLPYLLNLVAPGCSIHVLMGPTEGAACTALRGLETCDPEAPLLIANSDQFMEWNSNVVLHAFSGPEVDGGIVTFEATHPKWSYVRLDENGFVAEVAEKRVISNIATTGVYYWKRVGDFEAAVWSMMDADDRTNGEFYIAPAFNYAIRDGKKIRAKQIERMWGLGDPESLQEFVAHGPKS